MPAAGWIAYIGAAGIMPVLVRNYTIEDQELLPLRMQVTLKRTTGCVRLGKGQPPRMNRFTFAEARCRKFQSKVYVFATPINARALALDLSVGRRSHGAELP